MEAETPLSVYTNHQGISPGEPIEELASLGFSKNILSTLGTVLVSARLVHYGSGDTIYHEGADAEALYVIRSGRIKLLNYLESGRARIVRLHNRGDIIGLSGMMAEEHTHTAMTIDEVMVYKIPMHMIKTIKEEDPDTYCQLLQYWHEYLHMADTWIIEFSTGAIRGRVARLLRFMAESEEQADAGEITLLTVEEMAEILGVTPESVSRTMADLKRNNILQPVFNMPDRYRCDMERLLREARK